MFVICMFVYNSSFVPSICSFYHCPEDLYLRDIFTYGELPSEDSRRFLKVPSYKQLLLLSYVHMFVVLPRFSLFFFYCVVLLIIIR